MACRDSNLTDALAAIQLPLPALPAPVTRLLLQHSTSTPKLASPTVVRQHIRELGGATLTPVTSDMKRVVTLLTYCMADIDDGAAGSVCTHQCPHSHELARVAAFTGIAADASLVAAMHGWRPADADGFMHK